MKEIWDLVHVIEPQEKRKYECLGAGCDNDAVVIWATNLEPDMFWFGCIACQEKEFGGWPEGVIPPITSHVAKEDDVSLDRVDMMAESDKADDSQWEEPMAYNDGASDNEELDTVLSEGVDEDEEEYVIVSRTD